MDSASDVPANQFRLPVHHFALRTVPDEDQQQEKDPRTTGRLNPARRVIRERFLDCPVREGRASRHTHTERYHLVE